MYAIAVDEADHAALGWDTDTWARARLRPTERAQVEAAREEARARLLAQTREPISPELSRILGLPTPALSKHLTRALAALWG
jgi:hypothetical protein